MKIVLCGGGRRCCPEVNVGNTSVTITDDYGGKVEFSKLEFDLLKHKILESEL